MATEKSKGSLSDQNLRLKDQIEKKHGKSVEELYQERGKRIRDAIELIVPYRVPVVLRTGVSAARYGGLNASALHYDHSAYREACKKMILDFEPDFIGWSEVGMYPGFVWDLLDSIFLCRKARSSDVYIHLSQSSLRQSRLA